MINQAQANKETLEIHNKTISIKNVATVEFAKLYKAVAKDVSILLKNNKYISNIADNYKNDINYLLRLIYRKCSDKFGFMVRDMINNNNKNFIFNTLKYKVMLWVAIEQKASIININILDDKINHELMLFINNRSEKSAKLITASLQRAIFFYVNKAMEDFNGHKDKLDQILADLQHKLLLQATGTNVFNKIKKLVDLTKFQIKQHIENKQTIIAESFIDKFSTNIVNQKAELDSEQETNFAESEIRQIEANNLVRGNNVIIGGALAGNNIADVLYKQWNNVLDKNSRFNHVNTHGQIQKATDNFEVANSYGQIEYGLNPRADSFSAGNKIRCRCGALYFTINPKVEIQNIIFENPRID